MAIRGKTPRGSPDQNHWNTDKLKPGESFEGWIAGDGVCVTMHEAPTTKPCLKRYTGFDVGCPGCASRLKLCDITFFPVYREVVLKKCVVPLRCAAALRADKFPLHHAVVVSRPKGRNEGRSIDARPKQITFDVDRDHEFPKCIASWLPTLWGYVDRITGEQLLNGPVFDCPEATAHVPKFDAGDEEAAVAELKKRRDAHLKTKSTATYDVPGMGRVVNGLLNGKTQVFNGEGH